MLVGATNDGVYYEVDRDDASATPLGAYPDGWGSSGDIVSVDGLGTFATLRRSDFPTDVLARILFASDGSSVVTVIGPIESDTEGFTQIFGLGYWGRNLYGFTNRGQLIRHRPDHRRGLHRQHGHRRLAVLGRGGDRDGAHPHLIASDRPKR
ncbi:MAG: hypothetical protein M5U28_12225 [Sandaracinaceae bacterium]|nr:hypothetical protein [Sandaracinaceae bacterium]